MKKYIKPTTCITEVEVETLLAAQSITADSTGDYDGVVYCPPSRNLENYSIWGTDDEEN